MFIILSFTVPAEMNFPSNIICLVLSAIVSVLGFLIAMIRVFAPKLGCWKKKFCLCMCDAYDLKEAQEPADIAMNQTKV